jgi:hypothetical protein
MKAISACPFILISNLLAPSLKAEEVIKDKSPDGRFALCIGGQNESSDSEIG